MSKPRRTCLFCGRAGTGKEHILPQWIGRSYTQDPPPGVDIALVHETFKPDGTMFGRRKKSKRTAFVTLAFCETCNNTWMSALDNQVRPLLRPMMFSRQPLTLTVDDQRLLTVWATKLALGFLTLEPEESQWARPEQFRELYDTRAPLVGSQMWIGAREQWHPAMYRAHSTALRGRADDEIDGFGVVLSVGYAVFWVLVPYEAGGHLRLFSDSAMAAKPIWPGLGRPVVWPPALPIAGVDLTGLPQRLLQRAQLT